MIIKTDCIKDNENEILMTKISDEENQKINSFKSNKSKTTDIETINENFYKKNFY